MSTGKVRVACIQTKNAMDKTPQQNLDGVVKLIEDAVTKGAKLILLPELMPNEYLYDTISWEYAEIFEKSVSLKFISLQSSKYNVYIGLSFMEVEGLHFYNTFIMTDPNGKLICKIRKTCPAGLEAFLFNGFDNKHVFNTKDFGNIMVGICYENHLSQFENELINYLKMNKISLILQPHSCAFMKPSFGATKQLMDHFNDTLDNMPKRYANKYNIPVLFCNKTGQFRLKSFNLDHMGGCTKIVNYDGNVIAESKRKREDGVNELIIGNIDIDIDIDNKQKKKRKYEYINGVWSSCVPFQKGIASVFKMWQFIGYIYYNFSIKRRRIASRITGHSWLPSVCLHIGWLSSALFVVYTIKKSGSFS